MPFPASEFIQAGRFTEVQEIARGAYGKVYRARDNMERYVVVKEALPSRETFQEVRVRFATEAQIQAQVEHPNIIRVYHLERDQHTGELYLICEYANGGSLADYLEQHGKLSEELAIKIVLDICNALTATWERGIIHRDIKPSNILLTRGEHTGMTAKLGDFGVAQDQYSARTTISPGSSHPGTPMYMAPEQANSGNILDVRADIYALGITLWEMLTTLDYKPILNANTVADLHRYNPAASQGIADVIAKATQNDPQHRYQSPAEMANDLQVVLKGTQPVKSPQRVPHEPHYARRRWIIGISMTLIVLGVIAAWIVMILKPMTSQDSKNVDSNSNPPSTSEPTITPSPSPELLASACIVPDLIGSDQHTAEGLIAGVGLQAVRNVQYDTNSEVGTVISQTPEANTELNPCQGSVQYVVSLGSEPTLVLTETSQPTETEPPEPEATVTLEPTMTQTVVIVSEEPTSQLSVSPTIPISEEVLESPIPAPLGWAFEQDDVQMNLVKAEIRTDEDREDAAAQLWFTLVNKSSQNILVEFDPSRLYLIDAQGTKYVDWHNPPTVETFWLEQGEVTIIDRYYAIFPEEKSRIPPSAFPVTVHVDELSRIKNAQWILGTDPVKTYTESDSVGELGSAINLDDFKVTLADLDIRTSEQRSDAAFHAWFSVRNLSAQRKLLVIDFAHIYIEDNFGNRYIDWDGVGFVSTWIDPGETYEFDRYYTTEYQTQSRIPNDTDYVVVICEGIGSGKRIQWRVDIAR